MTKIWLINHYAMPPELEPRIRTIKFAEYLQEWGYDVTIISASTLHNMSDNLIKGRSPYLFKSYGKIRFIHIKTINYNNAVTRIINLIQFPVKLLWYSKKFEKPDIILHTALIPFSNMLSKLAKKLDAKYIVEILDLWPKSFVTTGLIKERNPIMSFLYMFEKNLYKKADRLIFSMEGGKDYIIQKGWDYKNNGPIDIEKVKYINNGVDIDEFERNSIKFHHIDEHLNNSSYFNIVYIGSIRLFNNVELILDAARKIKRDSNIRFLIYGDGNERPRLEKLVEDYKIKNVIFKEKIVDKKFIPSILRQSSLNLVNYLPNDIWRYGGSQSKLFQYLASGRPVLSNIVPGYCIISKYNAGISQNIKTSEEYANIILKIRNLSSKDYNKMCDNAISASKEFDYKNLTSKVVEVFRNL